MDQGRLYERYRELQSYIEWTEDDARRVAAAAPLLDPYLPALIDDFYEEIRRHPETCKAITGGQAQIDRLRVTLLRWLRELLAGRYDEAFVEQRWRVGWRHVEIGLDQVYANAALARMRTGLVRAAQEFWRGDLAEQRATVRSLNKLVDLDLAIIQAAYQAEYADRVQRNERLATLGQIAGGVAHELRNPLNVIKTSVYYLLSARNATPEKQAEHLRRIERQVDLADGVISALSSFAKMPVPDLSPLPVDRCLREVLEANRPGEGIHVAVDLPPSLPPVLADAHQLRIVFGNLIRNALDAMPQGGRLSVTGRRVEGGVEVDVADTGVGIRPEDLTRILEPLYSTKARGIGLGLAIARAIVEKCGGSLHVTSEPGLGSTFTVRLMATADDGGAPT